MKFNKLFSKSHQSLIKSRLTVPFLVTVLFSTTATAGPLFVSYDNFNYSGTVTRYNNLADAQSKTNATATNTIQTAINGTNSTLTNARDANLYASLTAPNVYSINDIGYFSTAWYFTTFTDKVDGWGNPNNTNNGFIQYYDTDSPLPVIEGGWTNSGHNQFTVKMTGGDGDSFDVARIWPLNNNGGQGGTFVEFDFLLTADFSASATQNAVTSWYETNLMPASISGYAKGIFQNDSTSIPANNGFYAFDLSFATDSWANNNSATWADGNNRIPVQSFWAAPAVVPEPASLALLGIGLAGLGFMRRRRN